MKTEDLFKIETDRGSSESLRTIHLVQEGTFFRAYEWSAWLAQRYCGELKATRRQLKNSHEASFVFVGFPQTSLEKFTPKGSVLRGAEAEHITIVLPADLCTVVEDVECAKTDFLNWKNSVPLSENKKKQKVQNQTPQPDFFQTEQQPKRITDILQSILSFPIEQKSPLECMSFLANLKQQAACFV